MRAVKTVLLRLLRLDHWVLGPLTFQDADDLLDGAPFAPFGRFQRDRAQVRGQDHVSQLE